MPVEVMVLLPFLELQERTRYTSPVHITDDVPCHLNCICSGAWISSSLYANMMSEANDRIPSVTLCVYVDS